MFEMVLMTLGIVSMKFYRWAPATMLTLMVVLMINFPMTGLRALSNNLLLSSMSWPLSMMVVSVIFLCFLGGFLSKNKTHVAVVMVLTLILTVAFFCTDNIVMFYIMFELSLIPIGCLIMISGYQPERLKATFYLFMYTITSSLPLLVMILMSSYWAMTSSIIMMNNLLIMGTNSLTNLVFVLFSLAFFVKAPMFLFHLWLPKAHVEAPVEGSMMLAAILLKLGGWGLITLSQHTNFGWVTHFTSFMSLLGGVFASIICIRQTDMKVLIAYSSVAHMSFVIFCALSQTPWGMVTSMLMMLSHSFSSAWMFFWTASFYARAYTRNLMMSKSWSSKIASLLLFWFYACMANMAGPPTINLGSEIMSAMVIISVSPDMGLIISLSLFLGVTYSLVLFSTSSHTKSSLMPANGNTPLTPLEVLMNTMSMIAVTFLWVFITCIM